MPINTLESLREHLQWAVEIEHATIPPYLFALYSLKDGTNQMAHEVIESIFMEEMLHMTLAANVLNAVGGKPVLDKPDFIPQYPSYLPHSNEAFKVPLMKFTKEAIEVFMKIEQPEAHDAMPEDDNYHTIGQFYEAIEQGLKELCEKLGEDKVFTGNPARQVSRETAYYGGSGVIIAVTDLASALGALEEIKEQGEGLQHESVWDGDRNMFHPEQEEVAHYFRFNELYLGREYQKGDTPESGPTGDTFEVDWDGVYNVRSNPRMEDYPEGSEIWQAMDMFNRTYSSSLRILHQTFNGKPEFLRIATGAMYEIKYQAKKLMQMPSGDGETTVGINFQYVPSEETDRPHKIVVVRNGPYLVYGGIPLVRKTQIVSEHGEPLTWRKGEVIPTEETYALCRCGQSTMKPFCDGTHARIDFEGEETADTSLSASRQVIFEGVGITVRNDDYVCMESGFCGNRFGNVRDMVKDTDDSVVRSQVIAMCERCPSGAFTYTIAPDEIPVEPDLPEQIAVTTEDGLIGALWVTDNVRVERADGKPFEKRNRVTLCRCGHSSKKPLCDGTHREKQIKEYPDEMV